MIVVPDPIPGIGGIPPSTEDADHFDERGDATFGAIPAMVDGMNAAATATYSNAVDAAASAVAAALSADDSAAQLALATAQANAAAVSAASALNAPGTSATSATSLTVSAGSKAFTLAQTGKSFVVGQWVTICDSATPTANWMLGAITAFNPGTGAIAVLPYTLAGTLTGTSWVIAAAAPPTIGGLPVTVVTGTAQAAVAGNFYLMTNAAESTITMPATPAMNDQVGGMFTNGLYTNSFARNGKTFYGDALDFQVNAGVLLPWKWQYFNNTDWKQTI